MDTLTVAEIVYCAAVLTLSYSIRGSTGFGGLNAPLLALVLPLKIIAPAITRLGLVSSYAVVARDFRHIAWGQALRIAPYCAAGVLAGLYLFATLDARTLSRALGVLVLAYGGYSLWGTVRATPPRPLRAGILAATLGVTGGLIGTLFGAMAGVFFAMYLQLSALRKSEFRATAAAMPLALGVARALGYVAIGAITKDVLIACAAGFPLMGIGILLGNRIHLSLDQLKFDRLVSLAFIASAVPLILR
jgi:hypothetical protein